MDELEVLSRRFAEAKLRAEVMERETAEFLVPVLRNAGAPQIFRMTIAGNGQTEHFRIWPGAPGNRVEVEGIDNCREQLVLLVQEPSRTFVERFHRAAVQLPAAVKVVGQNGAWVWIERRTDPRKRHFLCGRDERRLFICQLPRPATTVREAHAALRAPAVDSAGEKVVRQGEWFFVTPTATELAALELSLGRLRTTVRARMPVGPGGHPHVAEALVVVPPTRVGELEVPRTVFVRGSVRHQDHATVRLRSWAKVVRNTEPLANDGVARMGGVGWID